MGKFERGVALFRGSWRILRERPDALGLALAGLVASFALSGALFLIAGPNLFHMHAALPRNAALVILLGAGTIPASFTNFAITVIAFRRMRGEPCTTGEALSAATSKLPQILAWTLLSMGVGLVLNTLLERLKLGGVIASRLLGLAWALATMFVVPILATEEIDLGAAVKRSASTFKQHWGESVTARGGVAIVMLPVMIVVFVVGMLVMTSGAFLAGAVIMGAGSVASIVVISTLSAIVNVALYRFATEGAVGAGFSAEVLNGAFQPKEKKRRFFG